MKPWLLTIGILIIPALTWGAVSFDVINQVTYMVSGTRNITVTIAGSGETLYVMNNAGVGGAAPSAISYNSVALTQVFSTNTTNGNFTLWNLPNPASGANTLAVTSSAQIYGFAIAYAGASQTVGYDAIVVSSNASSIVASSTLTTVANNSWVVSDIYDAASAGFYPNLPFTKRANDTDFAQFAIVDNNGPITPAGTFASTCPLGVSSYWTMISWSVAPTATAPAGNALFYGTDP